MKITQMVGLGDRLFVLTDDGGLWVFNAEHNTWSPCKGINSDAIALEEKKQLLIDELDVPTRVLNVLKQSDITTIGELVALGKDGLKKNSTTGCEITI